MHSPHYKHMSFLTEYIDTLMTNVLNQCSKSVAERLVDVDDYCTENPPPMCSEFERPDKEVALMLTSQDIEDSSSNSNCITELSYCNTGRKPT